MSEIVFENGKPITVEIESEPINLTVNNNFNLEVKNAWNVDVKTEPIVVNVMGGKGDAGLSAYQTWLSLGNTGTEQDFIDSLKAVRPYKVYTFLLSYTGSISVVVLENTLGDIVWTTEGADDIRGTLINAFSDEVKTRCMFLDVNQVIYARLEENVPFNFERFNNDSVNLYSTDIYLLSSMLLEIRVYD